MADAADKANDAVQLHMGNLLKVRSQFRGESASECEECGNDIPVARQEAVKGVKLCVYCQEQREINRRNYR